MLDFLIIFLGRGKWKIHKMEMGDPKNGGEVEMIFFGRGVLSSYTKCEGTRKMGAVKTISKKCAYYAHL